MFAAKRFNTRVLLARHVSATLGVNVAILGPLQVAVKEGEVVTCGVGR
ncbi:hypothetical protein Sthe_0694 [Sphaerobacter thermophilus DSM 20745]|uniref:Uncharacterized protein n=1 Tax=Sphaerobacter thermophilus (strain ATCC 49802 / DSM 20745 / KCCM 41009 / NCIMB 13125 / S 6022) TaxID=479434 RepID=D1C1L4_SPHTD|nr:hypothetical protein Sthe_0694 [Sphaerobacter thermophilus DSM 20745]